ncbi:MAG: hypothetical protein ACK5B9_04470 [Flavobacteriia bacterium]|jgi:hypothetical protein
MALEKTLLRTIVDDLVKDFKQSFDDKQITKTQIAHWVIMIGNRLLSQHISKRDSGAFLHIYGDVPIVVSATTINPNVLKNRKYIELPSNIFDYDKDGGIEYITYYLEDQGVNCPAPYTWTKFTRTSPSEIERLYFSKHEEPSPKNPYFFRAGDNIYLLGIECVNPKKIEIGIYSTLKPITSSSVNLNMSFPFPEELLIQLKRQVLDLGRFVLMMPEERVNDGADTKLNQGVPTNKIVSVNELEQDSPQNM